MPRRKTRAPKRASALKKASKRFELTAEALADGTVQVNLGFAWSPEDTDVFFLAISANSQQLLPGGGAGCPRSPYKLPLGYFKPGDVVHVEWTLRAFGDANGIGAFKNVPPSASFEPIPGASKGPIADGETWKSSAQIHVPA